VPLPRLLPRFFYLLHLIFYAFPLERPWFLGIGMTRIAINFEVFQPHLLRESL